jgi:hypothetical protein
MGIASGGTQAGPPVVTGGDGWTGQFEQARPRLRSVAYRMSVADTDAAAGTVATADTRFAALVPTAGSQWSASMSSSASWRSRLGSVWSPSSKNR